MIFLLLLLIHLMRISSEDCVCTTVPCPVVGENNIIMGDGAAKLSYIYEEHNGYPVVVFAQGNITPDSLSHGSDTTSCTRSYARMLEDDGADNCDAGHILANHMGGYGNQPLNIFPQNSSVNEGAYNQFEGKIYDCISNATSGFLQWQFIYKSLQNTQPYKVTYYATFQDSQCEPLYSEFTN